MNALFWVFLGFETPPRTSVTLTGPCLVLTEPPALATTLTRFFYPKRDECVVAGSLQPQLKANFGPADCKRNLCIGKLRNKAMQVFWGCDFSCVPCSVHKWLERTGGAILQNGCLKKVEQGFYPVQRCCLVSLHVCQLAEHIFIDQTYWNSLRGGQFFWKMKCETKEWTEPILSSSEALNMHGQ